MRRYYSPNPHRRKRSFGYIRNHIRHQTHNFLMVSCVIVTQREYLLTLKLVGGAAQYVVDTRILRWCKIHRSPPEILCCPKLVHILSDLPPSAREEVYYSAKRKTRDCVKAATQLAQLLH